MSNIQSLKRRIKTAKNIKQITKAMEMVSASKMRKSQSQALASRPYARKLQSTLLSISQVTSNAHPLLIPNETGQDIVVLVSTDKSLAGSLNTNLFRGTVNFIEQNFNSKPGFIIVGQRARQFVLSMDYPLIAEFNNISDPVKYEDSLALSKLIIDGYLSGEFRSVHIVYMDFVSTLVQKMRQFRLIPLDVNINAQGEGVEELLQPLTGNYVFEPSAKEILDWLLPYFIETSLYQVLLEARASEHSARMVAMKNASDNATDIIADLTLSFNKVRQAGITAELLDNTTAGLIVKR